MQSAATHTHEYNDARGAALVQISAAFVLQDAELQR